MTPWERKYDDKALTYNLDGKANACEKSALDKMVQSVE